MTPTILFAFDFDLTLYSSKGAPPGREDVYYSLVESLEPCGPPGFDNRWIMDTVVEMRRALLDPRAAVIVLSGRPDLKPLRPHIARMLKKARLEPHILQLKPIGYPATDPEYKARVVKKLLESIPSIGRVVMFDDSLENLATVQEAVEAEGKVFVGKLVEL